MAGILYKNTLDKQIYIVYSIYMMIFIRVLARMAGFHEVRVYTGAKYEYSYWLKNRY